MIEVSASERFRTFVVRIGELELGEVRSWGAGGCSAYLKHGTFVSHQLTVRQAAQDILTHLGYGDAESIAVTRYTAP